MISLALIPPAVVSAVAAILISTGSWIALGVEHAFGLPYADLRYQLATADCYRVNPDWSPHTPTCDPYGRPNNYPTPWIWLYASIGATESATNTFALIQMTLFVIALGGISWLTVTTSRNPTASALMVSLAACAPATWLALERGSTEVLIFFLVAASCLAFLKGSRWVAAVALGVATVLKFYPVGAGFVFWPKNRYSWGPLIAYVSVVISGLVLILADLRIILNQTPQPTGMAFGSSLFLRMHEVPFPRVLGVLIFFACVALYVVLLNRPGLAALRHKTTDFVRGLRSDRVAAALVIYGGGCFTAAYLLGTNYDYRLICVILLMAGLTHLWQFALAKWLLLFLALSVYGSFSAPDALEFAADVLWVVVAPAIGLLVFFASVGVRYVPPLAPLSRYLVFSRARRDSNP